MNTTTTTATTESILLNAEQRATCAALATALEAELRKLPRSAKWWQRQPLADATAHARQMAEYGNGGGVMHYTASPVVLALAEAHGVPVASAPRKASDANVEQLGHVLNMKEQHRAHLRA